MAQKVFDEEFKEEEPGKVKAWKYLDEPGSYAKTLLDYTLSNSHRQKMNLLDFEYDEVLSLSEYLSESAKAGLPVSVDEWLNKYCIIFNRAGDAGMRVLLDCQLLEALCVTELAFSKLCANTAAELTRMESIFKQRTVKGESVFAAARAKERYAALKKAAEKNFPDKILIGIMLSEARDNFLNTMISVKSQAEVENCGGLTEACDALLNKKDGITERIKNSVIAPSKRNYDKLTKILNPANAAKEKAGQTPAQETRVK